MSLAIVLVFILIAALLGFISKAQWRVNLLLAASTLAVFALQPSLPIRGLDFYLPTMTIGLAGLGWLISTPRETRTWKTNWLGILIPTGIVLLLALTRYLEFSVPLTPSRPPQTWIVLVIFGFFLLTSLLVIWLSGSRKIALVIGFLCILGFFLLLKIPSLTLQVSVLLRTISGQAVVTASSFDIRWLGYSYIAFRLLHTFRDRQTGRLPPVPLAEYITYVIFFPTLAAGPIDRIERFSGDLRRIPNRKLDDWILAIKRIVLGLFKKFIIADGLALIALSSNNALQIKTPGWAWVLVYAYAFQLFFDFSGYTDIAIGTARLLGIKLPENFNSPYTKPNLTQFWNNWHMTLTQWFRAYFFNPVTRALRSRKKPISIPVIILITQIGTMVLIGLWHGVTMNFIIWGLWHGLGLFVHNRWSNLTMNRFNILPKQLQSILTAGGTVATFHFVAISWVFFALPTPTASWHYINLLLGN